MGESVLKTKSFTFAIRIVKLNQYLRRDQKEHTLSLQILRSGTAIGALVRESEYGQSRADFINKLSIALKEANETEYWLALLKETCYLENNLFNSLYSDCCELKAILISSINTAKQRKD